MSAGLVCFICAAGVVRQHVFANAAISNKRGRADDAPGGLYCRQVFFIISPSPLQDHERMEGILSDTAMQSEHNFRFERALYTQGFVRIAGTDEAGRGPLAGPVVAASVVLPQDCDHSVFLDSKKITHKHRLRLYRLLRDIGAFIGIGIVSAKVIDSINILQASLLAMKHAVEDMEHSSGKTDFILVDGTFRIPVSVEQLALIKGESKSASIAAASIVAKVERDALMDALDLHYPCYKFCRNKGYPTRDHRQAIVRYGPCPDHRKTFKGVKEFV